jgi:hypothetical protein
MNVDSERAQEINWRIVMQTCSNDTRKVARMWLYYTLFYWLIPTLVVIGGLAVAGKPIRITDLLIHGELLIYSITLVAGSTRLITKDIPAAGPFVNRQAFNLISHVMIFPAIFTYGLIRFIGSTGDPYSVSKRIVIVYSLALLIAAFRFSYVVFLIDAQRSSPGDVQQRAAQAIKHSPDKLNDAFNALLGHKPDPQAIPQPDQTQTNLEAEFDAAGGAE